MTRRLMTLTLMACLIAPLALPGTARAAERCFAETSHCISGRFLEYWEQNGGLPVFGFPISPARQEHNRDTGQSYLTQWFERNRFELHPENSRPYDVLLGRLGDDRLLQQGRNWQSFPKAEPGAPHYFPESGHAIAEVFWGYWSSHGLDLGDRGTSQRESLALFGLPISEPMQETNSSGDTVLTQWFERARFEHHPQNQPPYDVLLGLLGNEVHGPAEPPPPPPGLNLVRSHNAYISLSTLFVLGELRNDLSSNTFDMLVTVRLYNAQGAEIASNSSYTPHAILGPGQRTPFKIAFYSFEGYSSYKVEASWRTTTSKPLSGITLLGQTHRQNGDGSYSILGQARNDSNRQVDDVTIIATLYNAAGLVVDYGESEVVTQNLPPGLQSEFEVRVYHWADTTRYELQVEGVRR